MVTQLSVTDEGDLNLREVDGLVIQQKGKTIEIMGIEARNIYEISTKSGCIIGFAAEEDKGFGAALSRQFRGHWRSFSIIFFSHENKEIMVARHPFRLLFRRLEVSVGESAIGCIQQEFAVFSKKFSVRTADGTPVLQVKSPLWRPWTFRFIAGGREVAIVTKKWRGMLTEAFTDADRFLIEYCDPDLPNRERTLILGAGIFIDLAYFESMA